MGPAWPLEQARRGWSRWASARRRLLCRVRGPAGRVAEAGELCEALRCLIAHVLRAACSVSPSLPEAGAACLPDSTEFSVQPANLVHLAPHFLPPAPKHVSRPGGSPGPSTPQASPPGTEVADPTRGRPASHPSRPASRQPLGPLCSVLRSLGHTRGKSEAQRESGTSPGHTGRGESERRSLSVPMPRVAHAPSAGLCTLSFPWVPPKLCSLLGYCRQEPFASPKEPSYEASSAP